MSKHLPTTIFHVIERTDSAPPLYFDEQFGRDVGSPRGGWTADFLAATRFKSREDAQERIETLGHLAPFCEARELNTARASEFAAHESARPRYRLTTTAYINDVLLEPGAVITYLDTPGPHMQPINAAAQAKYEETYPLGAESGDMIAQLLQLAPLSSLAD